MRLSSRPIEAARPNDEVACQPWEQHMTKIIYEIVEHDGGWAYRVDGVFS